jgi:hypothetical protein
VPSYNSGKSSPVKGEKERADRREKRTRKGRERRSEEAD